jgi:hypothetical protein
MDRQKFYVKGCGVADSMRRAERSAQSIPHGQEIFEFLTSARARKALVAAVEKGQPPVRSVSKEFASLVGPHDAKSANIKRFVGLCISAVLETEGFEVERTGVWLGDDPVFSTGAVFRKAAVVASSTGDDLLERLASVLTAEELDRLVQLARRRRK